jgi:xylulokinase
MSDSCILAHDLGTTGNKASLHKSEGQILTSSLSGYKTQYLKANWVERNPEVWWKDICTST